MNRAVVSVDVREDIRNGREPFARIMEAVGGLKDDEVLRLVAPFEPVPLFGVLARHGFSHEARPLGSGDWEVLFLRRPGTSVMTGITESRPRGCGGVPVVEWLEVDARGLEPPQPLVIILESLARLPRGGRMRARTDRRPLHLYPHLEERGFTGETEEQEDGSFVTTIIPAQG
jgi:uncharacterized protein (DUF2249 family)